MIFLGGIPIDLATDSTMSTIIPSGTGLVEKNTDFWLQSRLEYNENSNEIRKRLKHSFGFHFLCHSNAGCRLKSLTNNATVPCAILHHPSNTFRIS